MEIVVRLTLSGEFNGRKLNAKNGNEMNKTLQQKPRFIVLKLIFVVYKIRDSKRSRFTAVSTLLTSLISVLAIYCANNKAPFQKCFPGVFFRNQGGV